MDRFDVVQFDDLSGPQGGEWIRIGGGSFGVVFRGEYLGTEVAIKEVLPNNTYDVEKYFERECVLMKEARHPNIVQYIGLTKSPGHDGRIYIISEFVGGNMRSFIADKRKPFDWHLRASFATDIARAVAYLHARNCMHRDLKGENLLITDNQRIKVCDFGFARIAARNEEEMRHISYCGTDGYMSPEILMGIDFSLPSDVFSLGVIFCEIISRHLVDSHTFKRQMPSFGLDEDEVRRMATKGCPADFVQLCIDMCHVEPEKRPVMRQVVRRLRAIEQEIVSREASAGTLSNIGSVRGTSLAAAAGSRVSKRGAQSRRSKNPRLPSFDGAVRVGQQGTSQISFGHLQDISDASSSSSDDSDVEEALAALEKLAIDKDSIRLAKDFKVAGHGNPWNWDAKDTLSKVSDSWARQADASITTESKQTSTIILQKRNKEGDKNERGTQAEGEYSTSVVRTSKAGTRTPLAVSLSKSTGNKAVDDIKTVLDDKTVASHVESTATVIRRTPLAPKASNAISSDEGKIEAQSQSCDATGGQLEDRMEIDDAPQSYLTARDVHIDNGLDTIQEHRHAAEPSLAVATIASVSVMEQPEEVLYHRFTLVKNGTRRPVETSPAKRARVASPMPSSRVPYQLMLANALTKCSVCARRLGFNAYMDCDDCPYKTHVTCADAAEPNCQEIHIPTGSEDGGHGRGVGPVNATRHAASPSKTPGTALSSPRSPIDSTPIGAVALLRKRYSLSPPPKGAH